MDDEFGKYLLVLSSNNFAGTDSEILSNLNSDEVLLISAMFEIASSKLFQGGKPFAFDISDDELRNWRKLCSGADFFHGIPITYNLASVDEYYEIDGYSHLAFVLSGLMLKNKWFQTFRFKIAAVDVNDSNESRVTNVLRFEFREQTGEQPPLQIWPPHEEDEYGYKFKVDIALDGEELAFITDELLSMDDYEQLRQLIIIAPKILQSTDCTDLDAAKKERWMLSLIDAQTLAQKTLT